jgi:NAD(P) transhydrogenase subunit alpha
MGLFLCGFGSPLRLCVKWARRSTAGSQLLVIALAFGLTQPLLAESEATNSTAHAAGDLTTMLFVFMLATFIGLGVITRVSRLLHTPLMSITNAISAIAVVGAISVAGAKHPFYVNLLGAIALFASTTNIVSGFLITNRMLKMFKTQERTKS